MAKSSKIASQLQGEGSNSKCSKHNNVMHDVCLQGCTLKERGKMRIFLDVKPDERAAKIADEVTLVAVNEGFEIVNNPQKADIIAAVGGDGSLFHVINKHLDSKKTFVGINGGNLGYRCAVDKHQIADLATHLEREPILLSVFEVKFGKKTEYAVQDLRVERPTHRALRMKVEMNGRVISKIHLADGILISNALGSTGYNRSAGGRELPLEKDEAVITPICAFPHPLYDSITESIEMCGEVVITPTTTSRLVLDDRPFEVAGGESVRIRQIKNAYRLITKE